MANNNRGGSFNGGKNTSGNTRGPNGGRFNEDRDDQGETHDEISDRSAEHHDNAAFHHESAAMHHRQASEHRASGNHADADRHTSAAYEHGKNAYAHGAHAEKHGQRAADMQRNSQTNTSTQRGNTPDANRTRSSEDGGRNMRNDDDHEAAYRSHANNADGDDESPRTRNHS